MALIVTLFQNPEGVAGATYRKRRQKKRLKEPTATRTRLFAMSKEEA